MVYVHYIESGESGRQLAFFPMTRQILMVDEEARRMIDDIVAGRERDLVLRDYGISAEEYDAVLQKIYPPAAPKQDNDGEDGPRKRVLNRLVIHLANDCNLRCVYCYANGGVYRSTQDLMSREMLDRIINVFYGEYDQINHIQFFGGEPLMNMDVLEYACARFHTIDKERGTDTSLGLVINGTLINQRFIDLVKKYDLSATVSYDGDPVVNDQMRVFPDGSGTSGIILDRIRMLRQATGQPDTIEVTYTQHHVDAGVSILDITKSLKEQFPGISVHVAPAVGDPGCAFTLKDMRPFVDSISQICDFSVRHPDAPLPSYVTANQLFSDLWKKNAPRRYYLCGAGTGTLSVSTKGDIYPCFMVTDREEMYLGSVLEDDVFHSEHYRTVQERLRSYNYRPNHKECRDCFMDPLCSGCIGMNSLVEGESFRLSPAICELKRKMTEEAIKGWARADESREE